MTIKSDYAEEKGEMFRLRFAPLNMTEGKRPSGEEELSSKLHASSIH